MARYEPPEGFSAAAVRYVASGTTDGRSFAAVIAQLAVRGCIRVEPIDGKYKLSRLMCDRDAVVALAPDEKVCPRPVVRRWAGDRVQPVHGGTQRCPKQPLHLPHPRRTGQENARASISRATWESLHWECSRRSYSLCRWRRFPAAVRPWARRFLTVWILFCGLTIGLLIELSLVTAWKTAVRSRVGG